MREINHLSIHQWLRSAIPDSPQPTPPIGFLFLKLPPPPCAVLLVSVISVISVMFQENIGDIYRNICWNICRNICWNIVSIDAFSMLELNRQGLQWLRLISLNWNCAESLRMAEMDRKKTCFFFCFFYGFFMVFGVFQFSETHVRQSKHSDYDLTEISKYWTFQHFFFEYKGLMPRCFNMF